MDLNLVNGINDKTIKLLNKLNIYDIESLLVYYPFRYNTYAISNLVSDKTISVVGRVESVARVSYIKKNLNRLSFRCLINNYLVNVTIFNRAFIKSYLVVGKEITITGKYDRFKNSFVANDILFEKVNGSMIESVYHLTSGITNKMFNGVVKRSLGYSDLLDDKIPSDVVNKYNFISKSSAVREIHCPSGTNNFKMAKVRLIYEEFFEFMFKIHFLKLQNSKFNKGLKRVVDPNDVKKFIDSLAFELTVDQLTAVRDIYHDLVSPTRMNRLVLGDVGSGKTIVSIIAIYINALSGMQSAMMAPTEILAKQHYEVLVELFKPFNIRVGLLVGSLKKKERDKVLSDIKGHEIDVLVGTHSILNESLDFDNLGLVITDEQHRFGVNQRGILQNKGLLCDVLYMSATPIPRTYALTIYGDMDTSIIKTKPNGRKKIITEVKKESELRSVLFKCLDVIKSGQQVYVVAPLIEGDDETELNDIYVLEERFNMAFNGKVKIGVLHGKMKNTEKQEVMDKFFNNEIKILISTTVIEVGIDVKNSTMMIIFNAERFGLATLHQLRGRVGRNDLQSYCYLISDYEKDRLKVMEESNDGFYISEKDFELRGSGDLFGIKQSGDMNFMIGNIRRDYKILMQAKEDVVKFTNDNLENNFANHLVYRELANDLQIID